MGRQCPGEEEEGENTASLPPAQQRKFIGWHHRPLSTKKSDAFLYELTRKPGNQRRLVRISKHTALEAEDSGTVGVNQRSNRTKGSESVELELSGGILGKSVLLSWLQ